MTENNTNHNINEIFEIVEEDIVENKDVVQLDTLSEDILQFFEIEEKKAS